MKKKSRLTFWRRQESMVVALLVAATVALLSIRVLPTEQTCVIGDMRARYHGRVPPALVDTQLDAARINIGLGAAAVGGWNGLGEALAVGGRVFVRDTNRTSSHYYQLATDRYFQSNAFVFVPADRAPHGYFAIESETRIDHLLDTLAARYPQGVMAAGLVRFATLRSIAMSAPAIDGEPVTLRAVRYYKRPMETADDSWAYVVLIAARENEQALTALLPPTPMRTTASGHALALRLREWAPIAAESFSENAMSIGQLVKGTMAVQGELALYPIAHAADCSSVQTSESPR